MNDPMPKLIAFDGKLRPSLGQKGDHIERRRPKEVDDGLDEASKPTPEIVVGFEAHVAACLFWRDVTGVELLALHPIEGIPRRLEDMFRSSEARKNLIDTRTPCQRAIPGQLRRRKLLGHVFVDHVHEHFERRVVLLWLVRTGGMKQVDTTAVLVTEAKGSSGKHVLEPSRVFEKGRRLMLGEMLALSFVNEERDGLFGYRLQNFGDRVDENRLTACDEDQPIVENEQTRLRQQIGVAMLASEHGYDLGPCGRDDTLPDTVAQGAQGREVRCHDELQLLFWAFEKTLGHHWKSHHAQKRDECNQEARILA